MHHHHRNALPTEILVPISRPEWLVAVIAIARLWGAIPGWTTRMRKNGENRKLRDKFRLGWLWTVCWEGVDFVNPTTLPCKLWKRVLSLHYRELCTQLGYQVKPMCVIRPKHSKADDHYTSTRTTRGKHSLGWIFGNEKPARLPACLNAPIIPFPSE